jgi:DNA-binding MarR family transcriptional regulator
VLDPLIHDPERLRVVATLAALPDGDALSATRLQDLIRLPPGRLISRVQELGRAGYVRTGPAGSGGTRATVVLTREGRAALARYIAALRQLAGAPRPVHLAPPPGMRAGDADRDAAAVALGEHFAQGRLTLDDLSARLEAALAATTYGELAQATHDLPALAEDPAPGDGSRQPGRSAPWRLARGPRSS